MSNLDRSVDLMYIAQTRLLVVGQHRKVFTRFAKGWNSCLFVKKIKSSVFATCWKQSAEARNGNGDGGGSLKISRRARRGHKVGGQRETFGRLKISFWSNIFVVYSSLSSLRQFVYYLLSLDATDPR